MSYTAERVEAFGALEHITDYEYALVYMMSGLFFCRTADLKTPDWSECLEARFFDSEKELHVYGEDGAMQAVKVRGTADDDCLVKKYELDGKWSMGKYLCVCEHFAYDADGQAYVALTRLAGVEGEAEA